MGAALYRKYRSLSLDDVFGQDHITSVLSRMLAKERVHHAFLLTGPRGVGKTSVARIMAHTINKLSYDGASNHIDIIEIDAASNRRIDEIRDLRDKVHVAPALAQYKVYIIDEVHMLTKEAFNALLKTLEEPPAHVVFILATTDAHKLPDTIVSRCIRFSFKPISEAAIVTHLKSIVKKEKFKIEDDALHLIAEHSDGSFRDSISLLDQSATMADMVSRADVERLLGIAPKQQLQELNTAVAAQSPKRILDSLQAMLDFGTPPANIAKQFAQFLRQQLDSDDISLEVKLVILELLLDVPASPHPQAALEIALLKSIPDSKVTVQVPEQIVSVEKSKEPTKVKQAAVEDKKQDVTPSSARTAKQASVSLEDAWPQILEQIKAKHNTIYSVLRMAQSELDEDILRLTFAFVFHQKRIADTKNKQIIATIASQALGMPINVECIVDPALKGKDAQTSPPPTKKLPTDKKSIETITNIFGDAEMLE